MGELKGERLTPRFLAQYCFDQGWRDKELITAVAVCLSESQGYTEAFNDNIKDGKTNSRDVGLFQINIPASKIGTNEEEELKEPDYNVYRAWQLYKNRGWQPWYGYTNGIALNPAWYYFSNKYQEWRPTGRYIHKAIKGVANFYANEFNIVTSPVGSPFVEFYKVPEKPLTKT